MNCHPLRRAALAVAAAAVALPLSAARGQMPTTAPAGPITGPTAMAVQPIAFTQDTLPNGLRVIYAPIHNAPVVQVRVLYHVGSRDERPDRQGFAHMFEHMMFRGSRHVPPQDHMKLIDQVGGICNAFTSFDQTVYHDTVPAEDLGLALYLEADRMASFKVTDQIYAIERKVVAQEWMLQQNRPYGNLGQTLFKAEFPTGSYGWTPIGNMQHLLAAPAADLQDFFNTYYVPNNAVLVIAGDVDVPAARKLVQEYFAWIPTGGDVPHPKATEPMQTAAKSVTMADRLARLTNVVGVYRIPPYKSDEQYALSVLGSILGDGASSRLDRALVNTPTPLCAQAGAGTDTLEYGGIFEVSGVVLPGQSVDAVKKVLAEQVADVVAHGVTPAELAKAKAARVVGTIKGRMTCDQIAGDVGDEALWANDADRVNTDLGKLQAVTADDVKAVAAKYLQPSLLTMVVVEPDPMGTRTRKDAAAAAAAMTHGAAVAAATRPIMARDVTFPDNYPQHPPVPPSGVAVHFDHGQEATVNGVKVIVLSDHRLPIVNWTVCMRRGSDSDPKGKTGLADLTAEMVSHGAGGLSYQQLSDELDAHAITLGASASGDHTAVSGSSATDELDRGMARTRDVLRAPQFAAAEFQKVKAQTMAGVAQGMASPAAAGTRAMDRILYGDTPMGRSATPGTITAVGPDDVKQFYDTYYRPDDAVMVISGDVTFDRGVELARQLTAGWEAKPMPTVDYALPPMVKGPTTGPTSRPVVLIDNPDASAGAGAIVRLGTRAYTIQSDEDKYAGSLANTLLSSGIESRLMEYVRAQKGYVYGIGGTFQPGRHTGAFMVNAPTRPPVAGDCITATFKVLDDLRNPAGANPLTAAELADAKRRVTGLQVMSMQTIAAQAGMRLDGILNGYPVDYYDNYASHIDAVTADQVRAVMDKYVRDDQMAVVVVAPASVVKPQLEQFGAVTVEPMPLAAEMMRPMK